MPLAFDTPDGPLVFEPARCLVAGWTGRDPDKVAHHIEELAAIGVPRPSTTPLFYRVPAALVTQAETIEVLSEETGGEAEPVILDDGERLWLTLGSDHTDRGLEAHSVAHSKAVAAKPVARAAWLLDAVADRLDRLVLSSEVAGDKDAWSPYQSGTLAAIMPLADLVARAPKVRDGRLGAGTVLFCGTIPAMGGVRPTPALRLRLHDPESDATLDLAYAATPLPVVA